jgi:putative peptidoglycan lipid II flippase
MRRIDRLDGVTGRPRTPRNSGGAAAPSLFDQLRALAVRALPRGALILSSITFVSFGMGLLKSKILAHVFGAGTDTDAFNAAFVLPSLILEVLVIGGLIASFVPIYIGLKDEDEKQAREFGRTVITLAVGAMALAVGVMIVFAPACVSFVAPGFTGEQRDLCISLFRILAATQILFAATWVLGEVLIAEKQWVTYAVAPIMYSGGIIVGALALGGDDQLGIYGAAVGAVGGALAYLAIRLVGAIRAGFTPVPSFNLHAKGLRQYVQLMLPKMFSQPLESMAIVMFFTVLASRLQAGSLTDLNYAREFQTMPELVIGAQFAIAAFPALSTAADTGDRRAFRKIFSTNLATIAVLSTVAALGLLTMGWLAVRILLGGGAFDSQDVNTTTMLVAIFAVSIPLESVVELLARGMYATKNTLIPTGASLVSFIALFLTAELLAPAAGLLALPAAYGVGMAVKLGILAVALGPRMQAIGQPVTEPYWGSYAQARRAHGADSGRTPKMALGIAAAFCLAVAALFTANQALQGASFGYAPEVTPWARVRPTAPPVAIVTTSPSGPAPSSSASGTAQASSTPTQPAGSPTPPGQFAMDLYQPGDFVGEITDTWCVAAAMQTMMNIMDAGADTTRDTQTKLDALAVQVAQSRSGGPLPEGWAGGLQQLHYGNYKVAPQGTMAAAVKLVVKQIATTNRPAGLVVWKGWHSWVVSGFVATADPRKTDNYTVIGLYIEDVWYNRHSTLNNVARGGFSRPPDSLVPYGELGVDFNPWYQAVIYPDKQHKYVIVIPTA